MPAPAICTVASLGTVDYLVAWELQRSLVTQVADRSRPNTLLLLEHPHTFTIGRRGSRDQVLSTDAELSRLGIPVYDADRGGEVTYHGPGQLVVYPIVDLRGWGGPVKYVRTLEKAIVDTLAAFGVGARLQEGQTGVWVGPMKIASIGVKISRGVSYHGLAINVDPDLSRFEMIVPCGLPDAEITSMARVLGVPVELDAVGYSFTYHFGHSMGFRMVEDDSALEGLLIEASLGGRASDRG